jgi:hypothetical protein
MDRKMSINIVWCLKTELEIEFSRDWLKEILGFDNEIIQHNENKYDAFLDKSFIVCCTEKKSEKLEDYIKKYNDLGLKYCVVHLSDEAYEHNIDFYDISKSVIRNYHNEEYSKRFPNLKSFPLGYKTGIRVNPELEKTYKFNFVGQLKSDRCLMKESFESDETFFRFTQSWNDERFGLDIKKYSNILSSSCFTLCPRGWLNLDSFRICESLECGSIPISILDHDGTDYFKNVFGDHPFIIGKDWVDARRIADNMSQSDIIKKYVEIDSYWESFKSNLKSSIGYLLR